MTVEAIKTGADDWIVYVNRQLYAKGLTEAQAQALVKGWAPPPKKQHGILR